MNRAKSQIDRIVTIEIHQRILPHYRLPFIQALQECLHRRNIQLQVIFGKELPGEAPRSVTLEQCQHLPVTLVKNIYLTLSNKPHSLIWQRKPSYLPASDLIITEQSNRLLCNHLLLFFHLLGLGPRLAFWGHGWNHQGGHRGMSEHYKSRLRNLVDFWFCYTDGVANALTEITAERKISVDNAIDTSVLRQQLAQSAARLAKQPHKLCFIGSMRPDKSFDLLLSALEIVRQRIPDLTMDFIGDGAESQRIRSFCQQHDWSIWHGHLDGQAKADVLWGATAMVNPGLVGLVILDALCAETPLITTPYGGHHSPEIDYLESGINGLIVGESVEKYAHALVELLLNPQQLSQLQEGCRRTRDRYTIENMAERFALGIERALALPKRRFWFKPISQAPAPTSTMVSTSAAATPPVPVVVFGFRRADTIRVVLKQILAAGPRPVWVFLDAPRPGRQDDATGCAAVRATVREYAEPHWTIVERHENLGIEGNIIQGLNTVFAQIESAIILEDDCVPAASFWPFADELLHRYAADPRILQISGNYHPLRSMISDSYAASGWAHNWGWATWARAWRLYRHDAAATMLAREDLLIDITGSRAGAQRWLTYIRQQVAKGATWDLNWLATGWLTGGLSLMPRVNLVQNIGFNSMATHTRWPNSIAAFHCRELEFPLRHPESLVRNRVLDRRVNNTFYSKRFDHRVLRYSLTAAWRCLYAPKNRQGIIKNLNPAVQCRYDPS